MTWENVSFVLGSKLSKKILECLDSSEKPLAPSQIASLTNIARSNVSTKLLQLRKRGLAVPVNPDMRKWRFYRITDEGKGVLREIREMK